jgi:hypothetical protein
MPIARPIARPARSALLAACLGAAALAPLPAHARDGSGSEIGERLADPATQAVVTTMIAALGEAVLDLPVDSFVRAMRSVDPDAAAGLPPDARVRDLAGPGAERLPRTIGREVPRAMGSAAGMAEAIEGMKPQLRELRDRLRQAVPEY